MVVQAVTQEEVAAEGARQEAAAPERSELYTLNGEALSKEAEKALHEYNSALHGLSVNAYYHTHGGSAGAQVKENVEGMATIARQKLSSMGIHDLDNIKNRIKLINKFSIICSCVPNTEISFEDNLVIYRQNLIDKI